MKVEDYFKNFSNQMNKNSADDLIQHSYCCAVLCENLIKELFNIGFFKDKNDLEKNLNLLVIGAKLHDIGCFIKSDKTHNKTGAKLILENKIDGLKDEENIIVANIVRFHRGKRPKEKHKIFMKLGEEKRELVNVYCSILRIADAIDYGHFGLCKNISVQNGDKSLTIFPDSNLILSKGFMEVFNKKKKMFKKLFKKDVVIKNS